MKNKEKNIMWAREQSPIVDSILNAGGNTTDCIIGLIKQQEDFIKEIIKLQGIAPRKIKLPNGKFAVWRCPENYIPDSAIY